MEIQVDQQFWQKMNPLSKLLILIGGLFLDWGMRLTGYKENEENKID